MEYKAALAKGAKSIEVEGGLSYEAEAPDGIPSVFFFKNGIYGEVVVHGQDQNQAKAEALAKLVVNKL